MSKKNERKFRKNGIHDSLFWGPCGTTHERFILGLLKKVKKENKLNKYIKLAIENKPKNCSEALSKFIS